MKQPLPPVAERARRRIALRLLPLLFVMYLMSYMDRANVSFANLRMSIDLGFSDRVYALGVGLFYVGYVLFEIPGALIVERWSARKWIARIMITWGVATILTGLVHTKGQFYLVRFLVGIAEASFFPGVIIYLTHWFRASDRAKAIGCFYTAVPTSFIVGSLIASSVLGVHWLGLAGWRWLFLMEGVPPILLGLVALFFLTDWPRDAHWLREDERQWITAQLASETRAKKSLHDFTVWQALRDRRILSLTAAWFLACAAALSITYWAPTFLKRLTHLPDARVALLSAVPGILGVCGGVLNGWHSDKTGERRWHAGLALVAAGVAALCLLIPTQRLAAPVLFLALAAAGYNTYQAVFWTMPTEILCESAAAASFGFINSIGQTAGFLGPNLVGYLNTRTGSLHPSFLFIGLTFFASASFVLSLRVSRPSHAAVSLAPAVVSDSR